MLIAAGSLDFVNVLSLYRAGIKNFMIIDNSKHLAIMELLVHLVS